MNIESLLSSLSFMLLIVAAGAGVILFFVLDILRIIIGNQKTRAIKSLFMGFYLRMIRAFCCDFKMTLSGDLDKLKKTTKSKCILIGNHQTEMDWVYIQYLYQEMQRESSFSAVMKGSLGAVPVLGYIVRDLNMCLLARNWESDRKTFDEYLENYIQSETPTCAYICPEGTTFTHHSFERSQSYAKRSNRPVLQHVLLPRSTGFAYMLYTLAQQKKKTGEDFYVLDSTMQFEGYHGEVCGDNYEREKDIDFPTMYSTFWKREPIRCHMHVEVTLMTDIIDVDDDLDTVNKKVEQWLDHRWEEKDSEMECFINNQSFSDKWNEHHRVVMFDRERKLKDSFVWVGLYTVALSLDYCVYRLIRSFFGMVFHLIF